MKKINCLLAGLPDTGKSTYIGGLWYNLQNQSAKMVMKASRELVDDTQRLESLSDKWLEGVRVDRTTEDKSSSVELRIEQKDNGNVLTINIPDFSGETFRAALLNAGDNDFLCDLGTGNQADTYVVSVFDFAQFDALRLIADIRNEYGGRFLGYRQAETSRSISHTAFVLTFVIVNVGANQCLACFCICDDAGQDDVFLLLLCSVLSVGLLCCCRERRCGQQQTQHTQEKNAVLFHGCVYNM